MISQNPYINCTNARLYYYDFLNKETREGIPDGALQHIKQCRKCQTEADRLKDLLEQADERLETGQSRKDSAIGTLLKLHFDYIGEQVKCDTVKPFLASLADPALQIRIPTPITTHIDKCPSCRDDLKILLDLHLPHKYLCRLGQLLADKPTEDDFSCSEARMAIPDVVSMAFHETSAEVLKHLCTCPDCRERLYLHRESVRKELMSDGAINKGFPCESVTAADIYDYCLPYGIDPADDEYDEFRESLTSHLRSCPTCLAKIQELHRTISNITERAESGVITVYNIDESEFSTGFPVVSETAGAEDYIHASKPAAVGIVTRLKEKTSATKVKPFLKAGLAAAAVIAIGFALLFNSPAAGAVTIEQIRRAFENAKNIYIATFTDKMELTQENWVSRSLNIYMTKTRGKLVLLDVANKRKSEKDASTNTVETSVLSNKMIAGVEDMMTNFLGLVPLAELALKTDNIELKPLGNDLENGTEAIEIYELTWHEKARDESTIYRKWRLFIDLKTNRPQRTEFYRKLLGDNRYILVSTKEFKYISESEMRTIVNGASL